MSELAQEISEIYEHIKQPLDRTPVGLLGELDLRGQWLARSAEILADAQVLLDKRRGEASEEFVGSKESWNIIKNLIEAKCSTEKRLYVQAERLNAALVHQIDEIRTLISYEKATINL